MTALWGWGLNGFWELGVGDDESRTRPTLVQAPNLASVLTTDQRSFGIGADGVLWTWGDEVGGRLGLSDSDGHAARPMEVGILRGHIASAVASGKDYTYARIRIDGSWEWVWWGRGRNAFLTSMGQSNGLAFTAPTVFPFSDLSTVTAFWDESIATTHDGRVFTWRPNDGEASMTEVVGFLSPVVQVETHGGDAAALDDQGRVYFWKLEHRWVEALQPFSEELQPYFASRPEYVHLDRVPRRVFTDARARFSSIRLTSGGALLALNQTGEVWAAGPNRPWAMAGVEEARWVNGARLAGLPAVIQVGGSKVRGFALDTGGRVWTWGTSLVPPTFDEAPDPIVVPELRDVVSISADSGNFLALSDI